MKSRATLTLVLQSLLPFATPLVSPSSLRVLWVFCQECELIVRSFAAYMLTAFQHPGHARSSQYTPSDTLAGADDQSCQRHLGIAGGSDMASYDDPDKVSSGRTYMKASIILGEFSRRYMMMSKAS